MGTEDSQGQSAGGKTGFVIKGGFDFPDYWTRGDQDTASTTEGWFVAKVARPHYIYATNSGPFKFDHEAAYRHVLTRAEEGSDFHRRALAFATQIRLTEKKD